MNTQRFVSHLKIFRKKEKKKKLTSIPLSKYIEQHR